MKVLYQDELRQADELFRLVEGTTGVLRELARDPYNLVTAEWSRARGADRNAPVVLTLSDYTNSVSAQFSPAELVPSIDLRMKLNKLYGELLQIRSHWQLEQLRSGESGART